MPFKVPQSMDECLYFTNRSLGKGEITAWAYRKECPKCHNAKMGKPVEKGKVKLRAEKYVCPKCQYTETKEQHEATVRLEARYTCPHCGKKGESGGEYKRKSFQGTLSYIVTCQHCQEKIPLTKKMKQKGDPSSED